MNTAEGLILLISMLRRLNLRQKLNELNHFNKIIGNELTLFNASIVQIRLRCAVYAIFSFGNS